MERARTLALASCALLVMGCDPAFESSGQVVTPDGQPVAGAEVWVQCDPTDRSFRAITDAGGHFVGRGLGWRPLTCLLMVRAPGFVEAAAPLRSLCKKKPSHRDTACVDVSVDRLVLRPSSSASK